MVSFIGDYSSKSDSKSRVVVPVSFRKVMTAAQQNVFVLRKNVFESCLDMYPIAEWENLVAGLRAKLNPFDRKHEAFFRELYRGTVEVEMDGGGRILLPKRLLDSVGIDKEMVLAGQDAKIVIWGREQYERVAMDGEAFAELTQQIFEAGK